MDINRYLKRIKIDLKLQPDTETLRNLHLSHLLNIPFENLDIHAGRKIILEPEAIFNKLVKRSRGGFCYEMNGLFYEIITRLGFDAIRISARVYNEQNKAGREFDHMAVIITAGSEKWLADVGFGESFLYPLKLETDTVQKQFGKFFKLLSIDNGNYKVVCSKDGINYSNMYRFSLIPRELKDFSQMCEYHQTSPESHFTRNTVCTLARTDGRITLSGMKITETKNGVITETPLKGTEEINAKLKELFNVVL